LKAMGGVLVIAGFLSFVYKHSYTNKRRDLGLGRKSKTATQHRI
jgi:hypothetical protein